MSRRSERGYSSDIESVRSSRGGPRMRGRGGGRGNGNGPNNRYNNQGRRDDDDYNPRGNDNNRYNDRGSGGGGGGGGGGGYRGNNRGNQRRGNRNNEQNGRDHYYNNNSNDVQENREISSVERGLFGMLLLNTLLTSRSSSSHHCLQFEINLPNCLECVFVFKQKVFHRMRAAQGDVEGKGTMPLITVSQSNKILLNIDI